MKSDYDAIVVGAGPAGSTAAILLATAGWSVALIEKQPFPRRKVCGACIAASNLPLLDRLGVGDGFAKLAGPQLREVALYCGERAVRAPLPAASDSRHRWGRALGREAFDLLLLERARERAVHLWQPWSMRSVAGRVGAFECAIEARSMPGPRLLRAPVLIMANGSWEGDPTQSRRAVKRPTDLLAFKGNFSNSRLSPGVLPVISYAGGYGGVVIAENGQLTFAGCIRRDALRAFRARVPERTAGEAFERYVCSRTAALQEALAGSQREGAWLGVGAIQPGTRTPWSPQDGRFVIGNAAAEAHPIIGEGISMAMQSASLLCEALVASARPSASASAHSLQRVGAEYARQWRRAFASRLALAATCAHLAMQPRLAPLLVPLIARTPRLMTALARGAGKVRIAPTFHRPTPWRGLESLEDPN